VDTAILPGGVRLARRADPHGALEMGSIPMNAVEQYKQGRTACNPAHEMIERKEELPRRYSSPVDHGRDPDTRVETPDRQSSSSAGCRRGR
jgi:hypothetical protein